ncbi:MAG: hypothetical protein RPU13_13535 [Candidatus Sedimenticola sp. (ex Thyasira tokunagai)]
MSRTTLYIEKNPYKIVPKDKLTDEHLLYINERIDAPEHKDDKGPPKVWNTYPNGLYAVIEKSSNTPVGLIEASGPSESVAPGWWLDSQVRGKGNGNKMVDALAEYLKLHGVTGVGKIIIQSAGGVHDAASEKLKRRYQAHFSV